MSEAQAEMITKGCYCESSASPKWRSLRAAAIGMWTAIASVGTTIAMTSVPAERPGMASGIMSAQRAIGSTVSFAVLGSVLAAWLSTTLEPHMVAGSD